MSMIVPGVPADSSTSPSVPATAAPVQLATPEPAAHENKARREAKATGSSPKHRISEVRQQQGVSLRTASRHMKLDVATLRSQENPESDLKLSDLARWQQVLEVPMADLLVDNEAPLSRPVLERARLVRMMKTAAAIEEKSDSSSVKRLAKMMIDQLIEVMPELREVGPWHSVGQRRSLDEFGQVVERRVRDDFFSSFREE